jgi:hypothetical protein
MREELEVHACEGKAISVHLCHRTVIVVSLHISSR